MFRDHFAKLIAGKPTAYQEVVEQDKEREVRTVRTCQKWSDLNVTFAPGVTALKTKIKTAKRRSVVDNALGAEPGKAAPDEITELVHPLVVKTYETSWVPTQCRGGHLFALFKGRGTKTQCKSHRDVVIAGFIPKVLWSDFGIKCSRTRGGW